MKLPFVIYADTESLHEKIDTCHSNPKKSSTTRVHKHTEKSTTFSLPIEKELENYKKSHIK